MLSALLDTGAISPPLPPAEAERLAGQLAASGWRPYPRSLVAVGGVLYFLGRRQSEKRICLIWRAQAQPPAVADFSGERTHLRLGEEEVVLLAAPLDHASAVALRQHLSFTAPQLVGLRPSFGCGDRLGLATPAHVRAVRGTGLAPFFAQQSIREMTRTGRTPEQVMDTATFGVFEEGYRDGFGADADHLKTTDDAERTAAAGFTLFTIDPGDHVDNSASTAPAPDLRARLESLPWEELETTAADLQARYADRTLRLPDDSVVTLDAETVARAAVKYGRAIAHTVRIYRHLRHHHGRSFELEMSVDETATPTSPAEHLFIAQELRRLGVEWVSLAPRFIGEFEKGVDYRGDLAEFERTYARHVAIAQHCGPYKISIHSGSDKFSIYPIAARLSGELIHVKTAGTSYLEALRAVASVDPALFREILAFAISRYPEDRASYHVSADPARVPAPDAIPDPELPALLDHHHARQVLHVTFGSVLTAQQDGRPRFRNRLLAVLDRHEEVHYETVRVHLGRHLAPFARAHP